MTVTVSSFRTAYPVFSDTGTYPDALVDALISLAEMFLNPLKWKGALDFGTNLFIAHHLVLNAQAQEQVNAGGIPGTKIGILNSKSVDKVSAGYDISAIANEGAGYWNQSIYGIQFYKYVMMFGAGGFINGGGRLPIGPEVGWGSAGGWPFG